VPDEHSLWHGRRDCRAPGDGDVLHLAGDDRQADALAAALGAMLSS
jgi:hypothetical protein